MGSWIYIYCIAGPSTICLPGILWMWKMKDNKFIKCRFPYLMIFLGIGVIISSSILFLGILF